jgi:hypothetical protein
MISSESFPPADGSAFARAVLGAAADVEAEEQRIKRAILDAAKAGDCSFIVTTVERWFDMPAAEVLCPSAHKPGNQPLIDVEQTR